MYTKLRRKLSKEARLLTSSTTSSGSNSPTAASGEEDEQIINEKITRLHSTPKPSSSSIKHRNKKPQEKEGDRLYEQNVKFFEEENNGVTTPPLNKALTTTKEDEQLECSDPSRDAKIHIPLDSVKSHNKLKRTNSSTNGGKMQRKYNMALQHFYQAATNTTAAEDEKKIKTKFQNLSGSDEEDEEDDEEEELFSSEKIKSEKYELLEKDEKDYNGNERNFFDFKKKLSVKRVRPVALCSWRGCGIFWVWCLLFCIGVFGMTYFLRIAIGKIQPAGSENSGGGETGFVRHHLNKTTSPPSPSVTGSGIVSTTAHPEKRLESCSSFKIQKRWHLTLSRVQTESALRMLDLNLDGIDDIIFGFATSLDSGERDTNKRRKLCDEYYNGKFPCFGGVYAVDGLTGDLLWTRDSWHAISEVNCNGDIDKDGVPDCLVAGRWGAFEAISGKTGSLLWKFLDKNHRRSSMSLYTPQFINDINNDGVMDVLQVDGGDPFSMSNSDTKLPGKIIFFSGKDGLVLKSIPLPAKAQTYFTPVVYSSKNGSERVVFATGGGSLNAGSLYVIQLSHLYKGGVKGAVKLASNEKGYVKPPVLVDVNKDGVVDVVTAGFSDVIEAFDGETFKSLWSYKIVGTEMYSIPGVGYYNDDDVVDFMVRLNTGPGFPVYYDSKVLILDGSSGKPISPSYTTSVPVYSSPLTVSMEGTGNDLFLFWSADCSGSKHTDKWFDYVKGTDLSLSALADSCMARYDKRTFTKLQVMNKKIGFPGKQIYFSEDDNVTDSNSNTKDDLQVIFQTGAVANSYGEDGSPHVKQPGNKFDVVFVTSHAAASKVRSIRPQDKTCIEEYRKKHGISEPDKEANEMEGIFDNGDEATNHCLKDRFSENDSLKTARKKNLINGRVTLHRYEMTCECEQGHECARVLPKREQGWSEYMGSLANGYFHKRPKRRFQ